MVKISERTFNTFTTRMAHENSLKAVANQNQPTLGVPPLRLFEADIWEIWRADQFSAYSADQRLRLTTYSIALDESEEMLLNRVDLMA